MSSFPADYMRQTTLVVVLSTILVRESRLCKFPDRPTAGNIADLTWRKPREIRVGFATSCIRAGCRTGCQTGFFDLMERQTKGQASCSELQGHHPINWVSRRLHKVFSFDTYNFWVEGSWTHKTSLLVLLEANELSTPKCSQLIKIEYIWEGKTFRPYIHTMWLSCSLHEAFLSNSIHFCGTIVFFYWLSLETWFSIIWIGPRTLINQSPENCLYRVKCCNFEARLTSREDLIHESEDVIVKQKTTVTYLIAL